MALPDQSESGRYRTIVADPPWDLSVRSGELSRLVPYPTMTLDEIKALPVRDLSDNRDMDAHLYLWTVNSYLRDSFDVARSWRFHPAQVIVWAKPGEFQRIGGTWPSNVEFVLFCRRPRRAGNADYERIGAWLREQRLSAGMSAKHLCATIGAHGAVNHGGAVANWENGFACPTWNQWRLLKTALGFGDEMDAEAQRLNAAKGTAERIKLARAPSSWFTWPRGEHSAKPEAFLDHVEQVSPGPYVELFARRDRLGWDTWGDESLGTAEVAA